MVESLRVVSCAALAIVAAWPSRASEDPLARFRWQSRVVVALAPARGDPALLAQRRLFAALGADGRERDLVLVEATGDTPEGAALRRRFGAVAGFEAILVGKDGGEKLRSPAPLDRDALLPLIDAMPMRRLETTRRP